MVDFNKLRKYLDELVEIVRRENYPSDDIQLGISLAREIASRARLGIFPCHVEAVTTVATEDFVIVQIYMTVEDEQDGLYGFGYAYNVTDPSLSEEGYLYTPPKRFASDTTVH